MAFLSWGKPRIFVKDLDATSPKWAELPTPAEDSTSLETTKGDKTEAKIEGGANEDVRYKKNTYALNLNIRAAKNRKRPISDVDGLVVNKYAVVVQPEDATAPGFAIESSTVSVEDTFSSADGGVWSYTFDALQPAAGNQVKWGVITVTESAGSITDIKIKGDDDSSPKSVAPTT